MSKLSIVVPAYNEEAHIETVVDSLMVSKSRIAQETGLDEVEIIVVNDGSTDTTGEKLNNLVRKYAGLLKLVVHEHNSGYGAALKSGFRAATGEFLSFMDADGTIEPESFISLYRTLSDKNADVVIGTRFGKHGSHMPFTRKLGNRFFALLLSFLSGQKVKDTASGIRLFRAKIVPLLLPLPDGLHFTPAMSTKILHEKLRIVEVPVPYSERSGESKLRIFRDGFRFLNIIVGTVLMYNPFKVFFLLGLVFEIMAAVLLFQPIYSALTDADVSFSDYIYRSIGGLYFFTAGIQLTLFGILSRFLVSTFFKSHESGTFIHWLNRGLKVYERMWVYGFGVITIGIWINALYLGKYLSGGLMKMHWAWLMLAAGFIIVGLEMIITGVIMRIIRDIKFAKEID